MNMSARGGGAKSAKRFERNYYKRGMLRVANIMCYNSCYSLNTLTAAVAQWVRAWVTLSMFEATVCGRS